METIEQIKARAEAAVPGAKIEIIPNPAGYHHNVVQRIAVTAV